MQQGFAGSDFCRNVPFPTPFLQHPEIPEQLEQLPGVCGAPLQKLGSDSSWIFYCPGEFPVPGAGAAGTEEKQIPSLGDS